MKGKLEEKGPPSLFVPRSSSLVEPSLSWLCQSWNQSSRWKQPSCRKAGVKENDESPPFLKRWGSRINPCDLKQTRAVAYATVTTLTDSSETLSWEINHLHWESSEAALLMELSRRCRLGVNGTHERPAASQWPQIRQRQQNNCQRLKRDDLKNSQQVKDGIQGYSWLRCKMGCEKVSWQLWWISEPSYSKLSPRWCLGTSLLDVAPLLFYIFNHTI